MANQYLNDKWQLWFGVLDVNKDGVLSHEDTVISKKKFADLHHLQKGDAEKMGEAIESWWKNDVLRCATDEISAKRFVDDLNKEYSEDKNKMVARMKDLFTRGFGITDVNGDGFIDETEFIVLFQSLGHVDVSMMKTMFKSLGPNKDGLIEVQRITDAWVEFATNDDKSVPCSIKDALDTEKK